MGLSRRGGLIAVWLALLIGTGAWTAVTLWPIWSAAHAGWFAEGTVGTCAAVGVLRSVSAVWRGSGEPTVLPTGEALQPFRFEGLFDGQWRSGQVAIFLVPAAAPPVDPLVTPPRMVRIVLAEDVTRGALLSAVGLDDPASACDFNVRRALRASIGAPLISFAGVGAIGLLVGGISVFRRRRARRGVTG